MQNKKIKLSILDQVYIKKGYNAAQALQETTQLASYADKLGYMRFWISEHHNALSLASPSPEILIAHLANHTEKIRIGSGGVMLPNHSALKMAENFKLLESLFPERIDMGIGRAPGTDRLTASILNPTNTFKEQDFIEQLYQLEAFFHNEEIAGTIFEKVKATPYTTLIPEMWLLSSSGESAVFAAHFGMKLSFAHFINAHGGAEAIKNYKENFKPSKDLKEPEANVAVFAFCSDNEEKIEQTLALFDYRFIELSTKGRLSSICYNDIKNEIYTTAEKAKIIENRKKIIVGNPKEIKEKLTDFAQHYQVEEVMIITYTDLFEDRLNSYKLIAEQFNLTS